MDPQKAKQQKMQLQNNGEQMNDDDLDDLEDLDLFHKSSLHDKQQLQLPQVVKETYNAKRYCDEHNQMRINDYIQMQKLGQGAFAEVKKVKLGNQYYAVKIYGLLRLKSKTFFAADGNFANGQQMFRNQIQILKCLNHGNLVKCHEILYGGNYAYLIMENCDLGQIMDWSQQKNDFIRNSKVVQYISNKYKTNAIQDITRLIFLQVAMGIQYMHSHNISNRDIKVDNLICKTTEIQGQDIKISDFTTVRYANDDISYFTCGTAGFRGPEIQKAGSEGYSCKALDIWSFGISMYTFYYQHFPFIDETQYAIQIKAEKDELQFHQSCPGWLKQTITKTTFKNWKDRININQVIQILTSV